MKTNWQQLRLSNAFLTVPPLSVTLNLAILAIIYPGQLFANPEGAHIVNGQVTIDTGTPGVTTITNSPNAIINWQNFNIAQNEITRFIQQNGQSAVLNRIIGQNPSEILGQLLSNGKVFLINPNGIVFGAGSVVDTQGLIASSLNFSNQDFLSGNYHFVAGSSTGNIVNEGIIRAGKDGNIILIAPSITNNGIIKSDGGRIILAAGQELTITNMDDPEIRFQVQAPSNEVLNLGKILSQGGAIDLFANSLKHSGEINADSVEMDEHGNIRLVAKQDINLTADSLISANNSKGNAGAIHIESMTGTTTLQGTVEARATQSGKGGKLELLGERVGVLDKAQIDADGENGGGQILVGGDYQGNNPDVHNAQATFIGSNTQITADAKSSGDGGKIIAWSEQSTHAHGKISAKGGSQGGDGGFVETSGHRLDTTAIRVDASAAKGKGGTWLLDPNDVTIQADGSDTNVSGGPVWTTTDGSAILTTGSIEAALNSGTSVTVSTGNAGSNNSQPGDITVASAITKTNRGTSDLTLNAHNDININAEITSTSGEFDLTLNPDSDGSGSGTTNIASTIDLNGSTLTMNGTTLLSGIVKNATLMSPGGAILSSNDGTLDGITIGSNLIGSGTVWVNNGLTLANGVKLNIGDSSWRFQGIGTQAITTPGKASLTMAGGSLYSWDSGGQVLSVDTGVTIKGYGLLSGKYDNDVIVNKGAILANTANQALTINPALFANKGSLGVRAGTLNLDSDFWRNKGTLVETGGLLNLGGHFTTSGLGNIHRTGGLLNLTGTLHNIGDTLDIGSSGQFGLGGLTELSGVIINGILTSSDGTVLKSADGSLNRVTIGSNLSENGTMWVSHGLTLTDGVTLDIGANNWHFKETGSQTITSPGKASVTVEGGALYSGGGRGQALHIDEGITLSGYGLLSGESSSGESSSNDAIVNKGTILANTDGQVFTISPHGFINKGHVKVSDGTLNISPSYWRNEGILAQTGGVLNLGGAFTTAGIGNINRTGGELNITGTLNNSRNTLDIGDSGHFGVGGLTELSGTIKRGVLTSSDGTALASNSGTLDQVIIGSDLNSQGVVAVSNGLILSDGVTLNIGNGDWNFKGSDTQTIKSPGEASLITRGGTLYSSDSGQTLVLGKGLTLGGYGFLSGGFADNTIINKGTVLVNTVGQALTINPAVFTNTGTLEVDAGTLNFNSNSWSNQGTLIQTGGALNLGGFFTTADIGKVVRTGGRTDVSGALDNTGSVLDIGGGKINNVSGISLSGIIKNGTVISSDGTQFTSNYGTLDGVTIGSNLNQSGTIRVSNGLRLADGVTLNTGASDWFFQGTGAQAIATPGAATLTMAGGTLHSSGTGLQTLAIGKGVTVRGYGLLSGEGGRDPAYYGGNSIVNKGTIIADTAEQSLIINSGALTNTGILQATGGTLELFNFAGNDGIMDLAGGIIRTNGDLVNSVNAAIQGSGMLDLGSTEHTLTNYGTLSPGASPGFLNINGNLVLAEGSLTEIELGGLIKGTGYDAIRTSGNIDINPGAVMDADFFGGFISSSGDGFNVLEANGSLNGTFSALHLPLSGFDAFYGDGKNVVLRDNTLINPEPPIEPLPMIIERQIDVAQNEVVVLGQQGDLVRPSKGDGTVSDIVVEDKAEDPGAPKQCK